MYFLYIIETQKGKYYTGIAKDPTRRFLQHQGKIKGGAKFFRSDPPSLLIYMKKYANRSLAQKKESAIKKLSRLEKENLVFSS